MRKQYFPPTFFHNNEVGSTPEVTQVFPYCLIKIEEGVVVAGTLGFRELGRNDPGERSKLLFFLQKRVYYLFIVIFS